MVLVDPGELNADNRLLSVALYRCQIALGHKVASVKVSRANSGPFLEASVFLDFSKGCL